MLDKCSSSTYPAIVLLVPFFICLTIEQFLIFFFWRFLLTMHWRTIWMIRGAFARRWIFATAVVRLGMIINTGYQNSGITVWWLKFFLSSFSSISFLMVMIRWHFKRFDSNLSRIVWLTNLMNNLLSFGLWWTICTIRRIQQIIV